ncbi:MAG: hypothetical protein QM731_11075 [Chitinophagaceae bacterium]
MRYLYCLLLLACMQSALAQTNDNTHEEISYSGNPYVLKDWVDGVVRFSGDRVITQPKLRFNVMRNQLMLQFKGSTFAAEAKVIEFILYQKHGKNTDSMIFRKGYPPVDEQNAETYYQVLLNGKSVLLKLYMKKIMEEKQLVGGNIYRRLEDDEAYYLLKDSVMTLLPKDRAKVAEKFADRSEAISQFIAAQQLKMRTDEDFIAVVKKYNEL